MSKSSASGIRSTNTNLTREETEPCSSQTDGKEENDEPEVVKVVTIETYRSMIRRIQRLFDKIDGKDSDVTIEKMNANATIPDEDDEHEGSPTESLVLKESSKPMKKQPGRGRPSQTKVSQQTRISPKIARSKKTEMKQNSRPSINRGMESTSYSLLNEENELTSPVSGLDHYASLSDITINDDMRMIAEDRMNKGLISSEISFDTLTHFPEVSSNTFQIPITFLNPAAI
jgi:hypothetical protein